MSILVESVRTRRRPAASIPSVREVCLLGMRRPAAAGWTAGEQVMLSGRIYRVEATRARADHDGEDAAARYVHLTAAGDEGTG